MLFSLTARWDRRTPVSSENVVFLASPLFSYRSPNAFMRCVQINLKVGMILYQPRFSTLEKLKHLNDKVRAEYCEWTSRHLADVMPDTEDTQPSPRAWASYDAEVEMKQDLYLKRLRITEDSDFTPLHSAPPDVAYVNPMWWCPRCRYGRYDPVRATRCVFDVLNNKGFDIHTGPDYGLCRVIAFDPVNVPVAVRNILEAERFKLPVIRGHYGETPCPVVPEQLQRFARSKPSRNFTSFAKLSDAAGKILKYGKH